MAVPPCLPCAAPATGNSGLETGCLDPDRNDYASRMLALIVAVHARMRKERPPQATGDADQLRPRSQRARPSFRGTPAEVYVLGGSHTNKAAAAGRFLCSVLGTQHTGPARANHCGRVWERRWPRPR